MARSLLRYSVLILLAAAASVGCHQTAVQQKPPPDPLLMSHHPTNKTVSEIKSPTGRDTAVTYPAPPSLPENPVAVTPASRLVPLQPDRD